MSDYADFNQKIIEEFRSNAGQLGGMFAGMPALLLHHQGRRSGVERVNPLGYQKVDDGWAVFASFAGAKRHPDWYLNLLANPNTTIEVGEKTVEVVARDVVGTERDETWERQKAVAPIFAEYQEKAAPRIIPVVILEPAE